jgi:hypothetical protein
VVFYCRTTTVPYFEDTAGERAARGEDGKTYYVPSDMKYPEWKEKYVDKGTPEVYNNISGNALTAGNSSAERKAKNLEEAVGLTLSDEIMGRAIRASGDCYMMSEREGVKYLTVLPLENGPKPYVGIRGKLGSVKLPTEALYDFALAENGSYVVIHTHNNVSTFSEPDIIAFAKNKAIKAMLVIDSDGDVFIMEKWM